MVETTATADARLGRKCGTRLRLLDIYLIKGAAGPFAILVLAICAAMMLERALRMIHELAASGADLSYFFPIIGQLVPYYLDLAIPAAFMAALVLLIARLDDDLELEAMLASGLSPARIAAPLVALGLAIGAVGLVTGGVLEPLGRYGLRTLRAEAINAGRIGQLQPQAIYHPADSLVLTFDKREPDGRVGGIFLWQHLPDGQELILTGPSGWIGYSPQGRFFVVHLDRGLQVSRRPGHGEPDRIAFDSMEFRESLQLQEEAWSRGSDEKEMTLPELADALDKGKANIPRHAIETELYSRIARAAIIPFIPLLVLPLAFTTKKRQRAPGILVAAVLLAGFHHGMNFAKHLAMSGVFDPKTVIPGVTGLWVAIVLLLFFSGRHLPSHSSIQTILSHIAAALSRLRIGSGARLPERQGHTLAKYVRWELAKWTLLALFIILLMLQMIDLLDRGDEFIKRGLGVFDVGYHMLMQLPLMLQQAVPIAALGAAMVVFISLGRNNEITALRAAGISQWRLLAMALPISLLLSFTVLGLSEYAVPKSQQELAVWWARSDPQPGDQPNGSVAGARWFRIGNDIAQVQRASPDGSILYGIDLFRRDGGGILAERLSAASATAGAGRWTLHDVERIGFEEYAGRKRLGRWSWNVNLQPKDVTAYFSSVPVFSSRAAFRALDERAPVSQSETLFKTRILRLAAEPLAPIVMLLLALPLAFVKPGTGSAWPAMLLAAGGGMLYLVIDGVLTVFAQLGYLPVALGAWSAPGIFLLSGIAALLRIER